MSNRRNYGGLDIFRIFAALLVIAIHTSPLTSISEEADFYLTRVLARVAVPFFLMVTGQFVAVGFLAPSVKTTAKFHKFLQRTALLYIFCIFLYLPIGIYAGHYSDLTVSSALRMVIFDGTFYHLWYFPACILGLLLVYLMSHFLGLRGMTAVSAVLYIIGLFGDSYYGLVQKVPVLEKIYAGFFQVFSYTRNGLFLAPIFLVLGMWIAVSEERKQTASRSPSFCICLLAVYFVFLFGEAYILRHSTLQRHDSMYFALVPVMFFLYQCLLCSEAEPKKGLRTAAAWIYILHPAYIVIVRGIAKPLRLTGHLVDNSLIHYIAVTLLSVGAGFFVNYMLDILKRSRLLSRIARSNSVRLSRRTDQAPPYETDEYDTGYQEEPDMQESEYQNDYESQNMKYQNDHEDRNIEYQHDHESRNTEYQHDYESQDTEYPDSHAEQMEEENDAVLRDPSEEVFQDSMEEEPDFPDSEATDGTREFVPLREPAVPRQSSAAFDGADAHTEEAANGYVLKIMSGTKTQYMQTTAQPTQRIKPRNNSAYAEAGVAPLEDETTERFDLPSANATSRAWIELDAEALKQNVDLFLARIPQHCRLMPAVKADAYGHGIVPISRLLDSMGVDAYSVACISEGIDLRKAGISGKILILGYTSPEDFPLLRLYKLTQTVVDYPYAQELNRFGEKLHVHIGIDTGMHRVGIRCENIEEITAVYQLKNLVVDGIFTHLCVSDSPHPEHKAFTTGQLKAFYQVIEILKADGYPCPGQHILASYGILNLLPDRTEPDWQAKRPYGGRAGLDADKLAADFVRPGIALYGVLSTTADQNVWMDALKPVLSLKAKVASIRTLHAGESVSYGITYTAAQDMQIAAITIGYADGLPRELSNGKGYVLINGRRAPIIGRICMDQCIVDITKIPKVKRGDIAVIIGKSGKEEITAAKIAEVCGTITHEILTGLAPRLGRVVVNSETV